MLDHVGRIILASLPSGTVTTMMGHVFVLSKLATRRSSAYVHHSLSASVLLWVCNKHLLHNGLARFHQPVVVVKSSVAVVMATSTTVCRGVPVASSVTESAMVSSEPQACVLLAAEVDGGVAS
jgi:hypothetical protein